MTEQLPTEEQLAQNPLLAPDIPVMDDGGLDEETAKNLGLLKDPEAIEAMAQQQLEYQTQLLEEAWSTDPHALQSYISNAYFSAFSALQSFKMMGERLPKVMERYHVLEIPEFLEGYRTYGFQHVLDKTHQSLIEATQNLHYLENKLFRELLQQAEQEILAKYPNGYEPPAPPELP